MEDDAEMTAIQLWFNSVMIIGLLASLNRNDAHNWNQRRPNFGALIQLGAVNQTQIEILFHSNQVPVTEWAFNRLKLIRTHN